MRWALAVLFCLIAGWAQAQEYPALYDVRGVASDDVLNIRSGPGVGHDIIGSLSPNAHSVEIVGVSANGRWLQLNFQEQSGWASAFYLQRTGPIWSFGLPTPLSCFGTEPFWSLERTGGDAVFSDLGFSQSTYTEVWSGPAAGRGPDQFGAIWDGETGRITATLRRESCNDGMSDRAFGISTLLVLQNTEGTQMLSGCCALAP